MGSQTAFYLAPKMKRVAPVSLPRPRSGTRPETTAIIPHQQLNQRPASRIIEILWTESRTLPNVYARESRMARPGTRALCLSAEPAGRSSEAFIDGPEFCHLHPLPEGSLHLTLPAPYRQLLVQLGWAEVHPLAGAGSITDALVMIFAPRDEEELAVVLHCLGVSRDFAAGLF